MNIRLAGAEDIPQLTFLRMEMLREVTEHLPDRLPYEIEQYLNAHIPDGSCMCVLMEEDGQAVAKAMACMAVSVPDENNLSGRYAILASVYTRPQYRGQGRMTCLLKELLRRAKEQGACEVYATPEKKAIPMYRRLGFERVDDQMIIKL